MHTGLQSAAALMPQLREVAEGKRVRTCTSVWERVCVTVTSYDPARGDRSDSRSVAYLHFKLQYGQADYMHFEVHLT